MELSTLQIPILLKEGVVQMKKSFLAVAVFTLGGSLTMAAGPYAMDSGTSNLVFTDTTAKGIYSTGFIDGDAGTFDNGTDAAATVVYNAGFLVYDGSTEVWADDSGFLNHTGSQMADGSITQNSTNISNTGITFPGISGLTADLDVTLSEPSASSAQIAWAWTFNNSNGSALPISFTWFVDIDDYVASSGYDDDVVAISNSLSGATYSIVNPGGYIVAVGNGTADANVDLSQSAIMDFDTTPTDWYGIADNSGSYGSSYYWSSQNNFASTGPEGSGEFAVADAISGTVQNDANVSLVSDAGADCGAAIGWDLSIPATGNQTVTLYLVLGEAGTAAGATFADVHTWTLYN